MAFQRQPVLRATVDDFAWTHDRRKSEVMRCGRAPMAWRIKGASYLVTELGAHHAFSLAPVRNSNQKAWAPVWGAIERSARSESKARRVREMRCSRGCTNSYRTVFTQVCLRQSEASLDKPKESEAAHGERF